MQESISVHKPHG